MKLVGNKSTSGCFSFGVFSKSVNGVMIPLTESVNGGNAMNEKFFSLPVQKQQAIINAADPWSSSFDPTMIWGPVHGAMFYAGIRINIGRL